MSLDLATLAAILAMAAVTYATRIAGMVLLRGSCIGPRGTAILEAVPGCVLVSVIAPAALTGGLADTVVPYTPRNIKEKRATGFMFTDPTADALLCALMLAMVLYQKRKVWLTMVKTGMNLDNSWKQSAGAYVDLFKEMLAGNGGKMSGQFQGSL